MGSKHGVTAMDCENNNDVKNHILILQMKLENCVRNLLACPEGDRPGFETLIRQTKRELDQLTGLSRSEDSTEAEVGWSMCPQLIG